MQYIHYAPYGELIANQNGYGYDERFKFTDEGMPRLGIPSVSAAGAGVVSYPIDQ